MPIQYTDKQLQFLKKKFAKEREEERCCDCPGCATCTGFVKNCTCDHDLSWLRMRHEQSNREGMADQGSGESLSGGVPEHVDARAFEEFGF